MKSTIVIWYCDSCPKTVETDSDQLPRGWFALYSDKREQHFHSINCLLFAMTDNDE